MAAAALKLTRQQWNELDAVRFSTTDKRVFRNATIILMSDVDVGRTKASIAHDLGCSIGTVDFVRSRYRREGISGLQTKKPTGRPSRATDDYRAELHSALTTSPLDFGYGFSVWSIARLNAHLQKTTGISFSEDQLSRVLHAEGYSYQRPKHTMKGKRDEAAYTKAAAELDGLKKKPCGPTRVSS
jgi:putative transposase